MTDSAALPVPGHQLPVMLSKMAFALGHIDEAIAWTDEHGRMEWCNAAFEQLVQQPAATMAESLLTKLLPLTLEQEALAPSLHPVNAVLTTRQQHEGQYGFQQHDRTVMLSITVVPLPCAGDDRTTRGVMLVARSLTAECLPQHALMLEPKAAVQGCSVESGEPAEGVWAQFAQMTQQLQAAIAEHEQTEAALRRSKERFRCIFDHAPIAMSLADAHTYRMIAVNQAHRALFGYSSAELATMTHADFTHPEDVDTNLTQLKQLLEGVGSRFQIEKRFVKKDGTWIWATLTVSIIHDPDGSTYSLGVIEDITDRKRAEAALRESQQLLQLVIDSVPTAIFWKDNQLRYLGCNHQFAIDAGLTTPSDIIGKNDFALPWAVHAERCRVEDRQVMTSNRPKLAAEGLLVKTGGVQRWITTSKVPLHDQNGAVVGVLGTYDDITERKRADKALRLTQFSIDHAVDPIWWVKPDGAIYYVNDAACRDLGDDREAIIGKRVSDLNPDLPIEAWEEHWQSIKAKGSFTFETRLRAKDGTIFPVEVTANYIQLNHQEYHCSFVRNITHRKQAEEQLKASLKEKEVLLKEVHHRVKNSLQTVYSLLNLQAKVIHDPHILAPFKESQHRIKAMALLHEKLYQSDSLAKINFYDYVQNLTTALLHAYSTNLAKINLKLEISVSELSIDAVLPCGFIINELVTNALKYAFPDDRAGEIQIGFSLLPTNQYRLVIADNGIGLPESIVESDRNSLPSPNSLGFQLVHAFVYQLRGELKLDCANGSRFELSFPNPV